MPMWRVFSSHPDLTPYDALPETIPVTSLNSPTAYGAQSSLQMDFSQEDRAPMDELNHILWYAIKGTATPYPAVPASSTSGTGTDHEG